jgi:hypothetical protein
VCCKSRYDVQKRSMIAAAVWTLESDSWTPRPDIMTASIEELALAHDGPIIQPNNQVRAQELSGIICAVSCGRCVFLLDANSLQLIAKVLLPSVASYMVMNPDGSVLACTCDRGLVRNEYTVFLFDLTIPTHLLTVEMPMYPKAIALNSTGTMFVDGLLRVWKLVAGRARKATGLAHKRGSERPGQHRRVTSYTFCCDDERLVGGHYSGFTVWTTESGDQVWWHETKAPSEVLTECAGYVFGPARHYSCFISQSMRRLAIWDGVVGKQRSINCKISMADGVDTMCFSEQEPGLILYVHTCRPSVVVIDLTTLTKLAEFDVIGTPGRTLDRVLVYNKTANVVMTAPNVAGSEITTYDVTTGVCASVIALHSPVHSIAISDPSVILL